MICNFLNFDRNLIKFGPRKGDIVAFVSCKNQMGGIIFCRLVRIIVHLKLRYVQVSVGLTFAADKTRPDHYGPS